MPDVLHWLGVTRIHRFNSMSDMKHDAIVATGIKIEERVEIPPEMVPKDAQVETTAKVFSGYHDQVKGREYSAETQYCRHGLCLRAFGDVALKSADVESG